MVRQDNMFLAAAPLGELNPHWSSAGNWLPGRDPPPYSFSGTAVHEAIVSLIPGSLPAYWAAWRLLLQQNPHVSLPVLGSFYSLVGRLGQIRHYTLTPLDEMLRDLAGGMAFIAEIAEMTAERTSRRLQPSRIREMSPLFS
jgi:hypothetical protein